MPATSVNGWAGLTQKALDTLKEHCEALGRDYHTIEKTAPCTAHLSGKDTVESIMGRLEDSPAWDSAT